MLINYLIIPILWGISVRGSATIKDLNSSTTATDDVEAMRLAKSELIRKYMNESIDPCEDFYQFACGNWRTHHPATTNQTETHGLFFARDAFNRILVPLLNETDDKYTEAELNIKKFYASCLNSSSFKLPKYRQNMQKLIKEFGRMPALEGDKWQQNKFDWIKTIGQISFKYKIGIIYGYYISDSFGDPTARVLAMTSYLMLQFEDTSAETINKRKSEVEKDLKQLIGVKTKTARQTSKEIVDFAVKLWKTNENAGIRSETTFKEMHKKYPRSLDVMKLVNTSLGYIPDGFVIDMNPSYVEALAIIVKKTPKRVLANYIFYALIRKFQSYMSPGSDNRSKPCLKTTKIYFLSILSKMVYRRYHLAETEQEFRRMWDGITKTLQNTLESNELRWFDDDSREAALEKLHTVKLYIPSFEEIDFEKFFTGLTLSNSEFMENLKSIESFYAQKTRKSLNERRTDKYKNIGDFTPSYSRTANVVRFPMSSLLTDYMWSKSAPHAFNYGRLGSIIAHEIMHGFSGGGRYFNKLGIFINWIYKDIEGSYEERRQCYYDQYHNFTLDNKPLPQDQSQAENVADNGGIYLAYHAYLRWLADEERTQKEFDMETLPHLNYTNKQLYFIGFSQSSCSDHYPEKWFERTSKDVHSADEFRAFVPLMNFGEFAKEFNCPSGSPMNPSKKCSIY